MIVCWLLQAVGFTLIFVDGNKYLKLNDEIIFLLLVKGGGDFSVTKCRGLRLSTLRCVTRIVCGSKSFILRCIFFEWPPLNPNFLNQHDEEAVNVNF